MNAWESVLLRLKNVLPPEDFKTWIQPASYVRHTADCLTIKVPNKLFSSVIRERFYNRICTAIAENGLGSTAIEIIDDGEPASKDQLPGNKLNRCPSLNDRYTFRSFVIGKSNELAHAAASLVAEHPGARYNPLFIYGGVGLGKTHLMQAVGNEITQKSNHLQVAYMSSEYFVNELINAIRYDRIYQFRNRYRKIDVLLIDDIQFLSGKERTQEEFFHTFNALYDARKQIILSSDRTPREIPSIEERLRSRFEWGLIADIQPPDLETKIAILRKKAEDEGAAVPEDVTMLIAGNVRSNIRELEGFLIRLVFYSSLTGRPIDMALAREALADLLEHRESKHITIQQIQDKVADYYNLTRREIVSRNNSSRVAFPRQVAMYLSKKLTSSSLIEIGRQFGGKHHSTVLHSLRKIENIRERDESLSSVIGNFVSALS